MMTRQEFESIAHTLNVNVAPLPLVEDFADLCQESNPRFDRTLFIKESTRNLRKQTAHEVHMLDTALSFPY